MRPVTSPTTAIRTTISPNTTAPVTKTTVKEAKHCKTIGIVTSSENPEDVRIAAEFTRMLVEIGGSDRNFSFERDRDHPNSVTAAHPDFKTAKKLAKCCGADIFVEIKDGVVQAKVMTKNGGFRLISQGRATKENLKEIAESVLLEAINWERYKSRKPILENVNVPVDLPEGLETELPELVKARLINNSETRKALLQQEFPDGIGGDMVGLAILGGAGPAASADFACELVEKNPPESWLHYSLNGCPGKYDAVAGIGPDFKEHYKNMVEILNLLGAEYLVTPCNTNHIVMDRGIDGRDGAGWAVGFNGKIVRYTESLPLKLKKDGVKKVLLLGTTATTKTRKLYDKALEDAGIEITTPDDHDQSKIMTAIDEVKAGRHDDARRHIEEVIGSCKEDNDTRVVLACTELPLVFPKEELKKRKDLVCVSTTAIEYFSQISRKLKRSESLPIIPSSIASPADYLSLGTAPSQITSK